VAAGVPSEDAALEAEVLVWANLRGVDSHGVLRIPWYVEMLGKGEMNARPNIRVERETAATLLIDGDRALGPVVTTLAMRRAIDKARTAGVGWAVIRNTTHQGAMAYYALMAANAGMAGIAIVCSPPNMAPFGARVAAVHNSPISIAVPAGRHRSLCVDMATSVAAGGKLSLARDKGIPLPPGWALDDAGQPTTDANRAKTEDDIVQLNATIEHERAERALAEGALETARSDYARVQQQMAQERATRRVDHQRRVSRNIQDAT